jgi:peroxin-12
VYIQSEEESNRKMSNQHAPNLQYASLLAKSSDENENSYIKPTIFDVIVQENMQSLFRTSFNHFFKWLIAQSNRFKCFKYYNDEIYLFIHSSIEFLYLKAYNALFAEYFYGMKRINIKNNIQRILSIVFSIIVPYFKSKLDAFYEDLEKSVDEQQLKNELKNNNSLKLRIKKLMLKYYPYFHLIWSMTFWFYRFKFMINTSDFNSPLLRIINQRLVYDTDRDSNTNTLSLFKKILNGTNYVFTSLLFMIQFYQWYQDYNNNDNDSENKPVSLVNFFKTSGLLNDHNINNDSLIPPPKLASKLENNKAYKQMQDKNLCPLCIKKRTNECVLSVSGFVFCYVCIFKFVREHQRCPLTNYPCTIKNIIRIYDSSD